MSDAMNFDEPSASERVCDGDSDQPGALDGPARDSDPSPSPSPGNRSSAAKRGAAQSPARQIANRTNATRSTGPRTAAGKKMSSKNAAKHGLLSSGLLPDEDLEVFELFRDRLMQFYKPEGAAEEEFVERIVSYSWRLKRVPRVEREIMMQAAIMAAREHEEGVRRNPPELMTARERELTSAVGNAMSQPSSAFWVPVQHGDPLPRLARYEAHLGRMLHRDLMALERLQAARKGMHVPAPIAIAVTSDAEGSIAEPLLHRGG
jgi:hypothetical protein